MWLAARPVIWDYPGYFQFELDELAGYPACLGNMKSKVAIVFKHMPNSCHLSQKRLFAIGRQKVFKCYSMYNMPTVRYVTTSY